MPTLLGKSITQATVDRIVAAFNHGRPDDDQLTATQIQTQLRDRVITKVKKVEDNIAKSAVTPSNFDLI